MINVLIAVNKNQVNQLLDNWRFDVEGNRLRTDFLPYQTAPDTPEIDVYRSLDFYISLLSQGLWKDDDSGPTVKQLLSLYVGDYTEPDWTDPQDPDPKTILTVVHYLRETFEGAIQILDAFQMNGVRHGQELIPAVLDDEGNIITPEQITGIPTYPPFPKTDMLKFMPDDSLGVPASDYKQVNLNLGQISRRFE